MSIGNLQIEILKRIIRMQIIIKQKNKCKQAHTPNHDFLCVPPPGACSLLLCWLLACLILFFYAPLTDFNLHWHVNWHILHVAKKRKVSVQKSMLVPFTGPIKTQQQLLLLQRRVVFDGGGGGLTEEERAIPFFLFSQWNSLLLYSFHSIWT